MAALRRLGLAEEKPLPRDDRPVYSEQTLTEHLQKDAEFSMLVGEAQRTLGRILSTEELKSLLSIRDYLRLPCDVTAILISYCVQRSRARADRMPGMRTIEKEAYVWADLGIDTMETAAEHVRALLVRQTRAGRICKILQIGGRALTTAEENYVNQWIQWGFPDDAIALAYEKTCLNTGGLKWAYLNSILRSWQEKGLHTVAEVRAGDSGRRRTETKQTTDVSGLAKDAVRQLMEEA